VTGPVGKLTGLMPTTGSSERMVQGEMKRSSLLTLGWASQWLGNDGSGGTVRHSPVSGTATRPYLYYYTPEVIQGAEGNHVQSDS